MIRSQPLRPSFKLVVSFTFHSLFESWDSERLDKLSEVLVGFYLYLCKARARSRQRIADEGVRKSKGRKLFRSASPQRDLY